MDVRSHLDKVLMVELRRRLEIKGVMDVERKEVDDWVSACRNLEVAGSTGRGRSRITWESTVEWGYEGYGAKARDGNVVSSRIGRSQNGRELTNHRIWWD